MCDSRASALAGLTAGTGMSLALQLPPAQMAYLTLLTTGWCVATDVDLPDAVSREHGVVSATAVHVARRISGGNGYALHGLPAAAVCTALVALASTLPGAWWARLVLLGVLALALAGALAALRLEHHLGDILGVTAAGLIVDSRYHMELVILSCALGLLTHLAADCCTREGGQVMAPFSEDRYRLPGRLAFATGGTPRRAVAIPIVSLSAAALLAAAILHP